MFLHIYIIAELEASQFGGIIGGFPTEKTSPFGV